MEQAPQGSAAPAATTASAAPATTLPASVDVEAIRAAQVRLPDEPQPDKPRDASNTSESSPEGSGEEKKDSIGKRIKTLTWEKHEADRRRQAAEAHAIQLQQELAVHRQQSRPDSDPQPAPQQFSDEQSYRQAFYGWQVRQAARAEVGRMAEAQAAMATEQAHLLRHAQTQLEVREKAEQAKATYPDFDAVVNNPQLPNYQVLAPTAFRAVLDSARMADVAYYLASNPAEAVRIAALERSGKIADAVREVVKLESRFSTPQKVSDVDPMPTVSGVATATKDPSKMTNAEYRDWRQGKRNKS